MNPTKIFVGNLDFSVDKSELKKLFDPFGKVVGINIRKDRKTNRPRGFAFVTFEAPASARAAIESMHLFEHKGRFLTVKHQLARGSNNEKGGKGVQKEGEIHKLPVGDSFFSHSSSSTVLKPSNCSNDAFSQVAPPTTSNISTCAASDLSIKIFKLSMILYTKHLKFGFKTYNDDRARQNDSIETIFNVRFSRPNLLRLPIPFIGSLSNNTDREKEQTKNKKKFHQHAFFQTSQAPEYVSSFWAKHHIKVTPPPRGPKIALEEDMSSVAALSSPSAPLVPAPFIDFSSAIIPKSFRSIFQEMFEKPSPIQSQAWPMLLSGLDLIGVVC